MRRLCPQCRLHMNDSKVQGFFYCYSPNCPLFEVAPAATGDAVKSKQSTRGSQ